MQYSGLCHGCGPSASWHFACLVGWGPQPFRDALRHVPDTLRVLFHRDQSPPGSEAPLLHGCDNCCFWPARFSSRVTKPGPRQITHGSRHPGHPKLRGRGNSLQPRAHANPGAARRARFRRGRGAPPGSTAPAGQLPPARARTGRPGRTGRRAPQGATAWSAWCGPPRAAI